MIHLVVIEKSLFVRIAGAFLPPHGSKLLEISRWTVMRARFPQFHGGFRSVISRLRSPSKNAVATYALVAGLGAIVLHGAEISVEQTTETGKEIPRMEQDAQLTFFKLEHRNGDLRFPKDGTKEQYERALRLYFKKNNIPIEQSDPMGFATFLEVFVKVLGNDHGFINSAFYNTMADDLSRFNELASYLRGSSLDQRFLISVREYYAKSIRQDFTLDVTREKARLASIPLDSRFVAVKNDQILDIDAYYPEFRNLALDKREKAKRYLGDLNPLIVFAIGNSHSSKYVMDQDGYIALPPSKVVLDAISK